MVRRDQPGKTAMTPDRIAEAIPRLLDEIQDALLQRGRERLAAGIRDATTVADALDAATTGFARVPYAVLGERGEDELAGNAVKVRCLQTADGELPTPGVDEELFASVGRSY